MIENHILDCKTHGRVGPLGIVLVCGQCYDESRHLRIRLTELEKFVKKVALTNRFTWDTELSKEAQSLIDQAGEVK